MGSVEVSMNPDLIRRPEGKERGRCRYGGNVLLTCMERRISRNSVKKAHTIFDRQNLCRTRVTGKTP